jgi:hypothetical protein
MFTVWIENEANHSDRIMCRCTNRLAADHIARWVNDSQNLHAVIVDPARW